MDEHNFIAIATGKRTIVKIGEPCTFYPSGKGSWIILRDEKSGAEFETMMHEEVFQILDVLKDLDLTHNRVLIDTIWKFAEFIKNDALNDRAMQDAGADL